MWLASRLRSDPDNKYINFFPCSPCIRDGPSRGAMMNASILSARDICRGGGLGILISSFLLTTPGCPSLSLICSSSWYRTRLGWRPRRLCVPPSWLSSKDSLSLMRRGSSSSASWSTRSPVSLQRENSESADSADDRRPLRFSSGESISEAESLSRRREDRVWRGMLAGLRGLAEREGILAAFLG